jgi:hypothetical protein
VLAPHAPTEPDDRGAITAMLVVGTVSQFLWGGDGWGIALRVERQQTSRTTIGGELTGGRGSEGEYEDGTLFRQSLLGIRAYGRTSPSKTDEVAFSYGVGLSWMKTGLVTSTLQTSFIASAPNEHLVPLAALSFALAVPLRYGRAFGDKPPKESYGFRLPELGRPAVWPPPPEPSRHSVPHVDVYLGLDLGLLVPIGDTGNRLSVDLGAAKPLLSRSLVLSASAGESQTFTP